MIPAGRAGGEPGGDNASEGRIVAKFGVLGYSVRKLAPPRHGCYALIGPARRMDGRLGGPGPRRGSKGSMQADWEGRRFKWDGRR